jgi:hypothetical protein
MAKSASRVSTFGDLAMKFQDQIQHTQSSLADRRQQAADRYSAAMRTLERLALAKNELAGYSASRFSAMIGGQ